jgi:hypothetical protein
VLNRKYLSAGVVSESVIHESVMEWVRAHPKISPFVMHFPNEGKRSIQYGAYLKRLGMRPGVSDLFIAIPKRGYHGAWLELKSANGKLSLLQKLFLEDMAKQEYAAVVTYSLDDSIKFIQWYCEI